MNETVKLLIHQGLIEGRTYESKYCFNDVVEEYKFRWGELWNDFSGALDYWVNVKNASAFEDKTIVAAIGKLILAAYQMNTHALNLD